MRLLDKIELFRGEAAFSTWAHRLAVNYLINHTRRKRAEEVAYNELDDARQEAPTPHLGMAIERAVATLPEGFRKVFILHDQEGYRHDEIAQILGCSPANSRSQLCRARVALREKLKPMMLKEATS